ncbi:MAG: HAD family hydrolase [Bacteroidetes bacterium]|nr:HAD family hydrolase [Bacteroidota bacterium]
MESYKIKLKDIDTFVFDFDGVLTDGMVLLMENEFVRNLNSKDSYAIQHASKMGYKLFVITGGSSETARTRLISLGMQEVILNAENKLKHFEVLAQKHNLKFENTLYMGDDIPDIPLLEKVRISACPQDAVPEVRGKSHYISHNLGGKGAVRDVIEQVLKVQGKWLTPESYEW